MSRILYGLSGEGAGHAVRSREVIRHLREQGHEVEVVTYGRGAEILRDEEPTIHEVVGIHLTYEDNAVDYTKTIWQNVFKKRVANENLKRYLPKPLREFFSTKVASESLNRIKERCRTWPTDLVITDFEPFTALAANQLGLPLISLDNIHSLMFNPGLIPLTQRYRFFVAKIMIKLVVPEASRYLVTTLQTDVQSQTAGVTFAPAIVRPAVLAAKPEAGEHILIYSSFADETLPALLMALARQLGVHFVVYGYGTRPSISRVVFRPWNEAAFVEDLRTCRAVVGTGGFTLISESLVLHKPYLALPIGGQFEQMANALAVRRLGYGDLTKRLDRRSFHRFRANVSEYRRHLADYIHPGNQPTFSALDQLIDEVPKGVIR